MVLWLSKKRMVVFRKGLVENHQKKLNWNDDSIVIWGITSPKTNMSPENQWLEDVFPIELVIF